MKMGGGGFRPPSTPLLNKPLGIPPRRKTRPAFFDYFFFRIEPNSTLIQFESFEKNGIETIMVTINKTTDVLAENGDWQLERRRKSIFDKIRSVNGCRPYDLEFFFF